MNVFTLQMYTNAGCRNSKSSDVVRVKKSSSITSDPLSIMLDGDDPLSLFQKQSLEQIEKEEEVNFTLNLILKFYNIFAEVSSHSRICYRFYKGKVIVYIYIKLTGF